MSGVKLPRTANLAIPPLPWWLSLVLASAGSLLLVVLGLAILASPSPLSNGPVWIAALVEGWIWHEPWQQWSINHYPGVSANLVIRHRLPVALAFLLIALALYCGLIWLNRRQFSRHGFDWRVAGGLLLCAWLLLDLPWQWSLWQQLDKTRQDFAGQSPAVKARRMYDAGLVEVLHELRPLMPGESTRVFIATAPAHEFLAIRAAYRLYPLNVFWRRWGSELPEAHWLRPGDLVLALAARDLRYDREHQQLHWGKNQQRAAETLAADSRSALYLITPDETLP
jgi:hypothetical protein